MEKLPIIVVKKIYYEMFKDGRKAVEHRRHRGQFNARVFFPGRRTRIAYRYDWPHYESLVAEVVMFRVRTVCEVPDQSDCYPGLRRGDEIAEIHLRIVGPG